MGRSLMSMNGRHMPSPSLFRLHLTCNATMKKLRHSVMTLSRQSQVTACMHYRSSNTHVTKEVSQEKRMPKTYIS